MEGVIRAMPSPATAGTSMRAMTTKRAGVKCTAGPVQGPCAALRTDLRAFHGVLTRDLHLPVATYEAMVNMKRVTPTRMKRMCGHDLSLYSKSNHTTLAQAYRGGPTLTPIR